MGKLNRIPDILEREAGHFQSIKRPTQDRQPLTFLFIVNLELPINLTSRGSTHRESMQTPPGQEIHTQDLLAVRQQC